MHQIYQILTHLCQAFDYYFLLLLDINPIIKKVLQISHEMNEAQRFNTI